MGSRPSCANNWLGLTFDLSLPSAYLSLYSHRTRELDQASCRADVLWPEEGTQQEKLSFQPLHLVPYLLTPTF